LKKTISLAILTCFLLIAAVIVPPVSADPKGPVQGPVQTGLYGALTINGFSAPAGIPVNAYMEGGLLGTVETGPTLDLPLLADNEYWMTVSGTDEDIGKTVSFTVTYLDTDYDAPETGTFEYAAQMVDLSIEVPVPDEVWVNDDWEGLGFGDPADGHTFGYDAFATIQDGIDNVGSSTVNVLPGTYDGFEVEETEDLDIIGEEGAVVTGAINVIIESEEFWVMAMVINSQNIDIEGLDFDGSGIAGKEVLEGIAYAGSTGSITDVTVSDVAGSEMGMGISVWGGEIDTVNISDTTVEGCQIGVMVGDDQVNLEDCTITGPAGGDVYSVGIIALNGAIVNIESCEISDFWADDPEPGQAGFGVYAMAEMLLETPALAHQFAAVGDGSTTVEITGCSKITDNNFGIAVVDSILVANGNNIVGNDILGIYNDSAAEVDAEENWWGDAQGPEHEDNPFFATTTGDAVSDNVDYIPWLDASCPGGNPTPGGPEADFVAEPRSGIAPLDVQLTDLSTSEFDIVSWAWDLGDGTTSAEQDPAHTYIEAGTYTVSLTVTDELGLSDTETKSTYIIVRRELPGEVTPEPANLKAVYFLISPEQVMPNQQVKISINIGNDGGTVGTRSVALYINGVLEDSQTVTVSPGSSQLVVFTVTKAEPGTYQVLLEGNEGQFTVLGRAAAGHWAGPLGTGGIIAIVVFVIALVLGLVFILRRE
jgi:PKD repeat protein